MGIKKTHPTVYLSLGSNLGDRIQHLHDAQNELEKEVGEISAISQIFENPPCGFDAEQDFLNMCVKLSTDHSPSDLLKAVKRIEKQLGRLETKQKGYSSRCIDIDIILCGNTVLHSEKLTIPHPHFRKRMFVLKPLKDIAFNEIDPETMLTIEQLFNNCGDQSTMRVYNH